MFKSKKLVAIVALIVVILAGGTYWLTGKDSTNNQINDASNSQQEEQAIVQMPEITFSEDGKTVSYDGVEGKTALEILKEGTDVTTQSSSYGDFVTGINGREADASSEYWSFYVNGSYASEGAGTYQSKTGDKIEWKLESL